MRGKHGTRLCDGSFPNFDSLCRGGGVGSGAGAEGRCKNVGICAMGPVEERLAGVSGLFYVFQQGCSIATGILMKAISGKPGRGKGWHL